MLYDQSGEMTMSMTLSVTDFKARCLELFDRLQDGRLDRIDVTRRGKLVAVVESPARHDEADARCVHGSMASMTIIPDDFDLTAPVFDGPIDAEDGILHR